MAGKDVGARCARNNPTPNIIPIREGIAIAPEPRAEDTETADRRRMADSAEEAWWEKIADGESDDKGLHALYVIKEGARAMLPCNKLKLRLHPKEVTEDWFWQAYKETEVADREQEYVEAQWSLAYFHHERTGGDQHKVWDAKRAETSRKRDGALDKLIHTPALKLDHVKLKQRMLGRAEWARKYRPALQAVIDDEVARLTAEKERRRADREARKAKRLAGEA